MFKVIIERRDGSMFTYHRAEYKVDADKAAEYARESIAKGGWNGARNVEVVYYESA